MRDTFKTRGDFLFRGTFLHYGPFFLSALFKKGYFYSNKNTFRNFPWLSGACKIGLANLLHDGFSLHIFKYLLTLPYGQFLFSIRVAFKNGHITRSFLVGHKFCWHSKWLIVLPILNSWIIFILCPQDVNSSCSAVLVPKGLWPFVEFKNIIVCLQLFFSRKGCLEIGTFKLVQTMSSFN